VLRVRGGMVCAMNRTLPIVCALAATALADTPPKKPAGGAYTGHGAESVSPEVIAKFSAPALDPIVSRRIQSMLDVRGSGGGILTARGDRMFFTSRLTGTNQVWRQDGPMRWAVQLTGGEDRTAVVELAPDDSFLAISRDIGGTENPGLYLMSPDGGALRLVQHTPKVQTALQYITDDSKALYFSANDIDPASYAIYRFDVKTGKRELVFDTPGLWDIADHRGDTWLLVKNLGNTQQEVYQYELASKKLTPLLGQGEVVQYEVAFGAKPGQVLVRTDKLGDFQRVYAFEAGKLTPITPELKYDIESFKIDDARARIYYEINEQGYTKSGILDAKTLRPIAMPKLPGSEGADNVGLASVSRNGRFATFGVDGATLPSVGLTYDWQTGRATTWRQTMTPEVDTKAFAKVALESYPARDGTKIPMFVRRPASCDGPCPVIVEFHGGPEGQSQAGFSGRAQMFVDAGFVFVQPNVRGSTGYGKAWLHSDNGPKRMQVITDIEDCAKFIRASWGKDGKAPKIGVMGGSYGGYAVLMAMTYFAGAYDAGVQEVGISNLTTFLMNTAPYRRILRTSEYGDPVKDKEALVQLSPITYVKKLKAPLLSIQGVNDPRVPVGEALQIYKEAEARRIPGGLILFADEGHGTAKRGNQVLAIGHTIAFFDKHLRAR
jgi:dipeptidyl aminopeptidase/acylaminoacyl peptidase